ncbi:MAG TPA: sulfite exporter TauE/SafE family protein [Solirubrobacteraceae bacterium]|nr:sulfite exporter TauE/SafE family protein [Solirubrobacteraceae bacterium]
MKDPGWLLLAGFGGGLLGSVAGLASLISYPALLAVGLPPLSANVSNTVALVFGGVGSVSGSMVELRGQRAHARRLGAIAIAGGICGGLLLLATPSGAFVRIVPWLIGAASLAILVPRRSIPPASARTRRATWVLGGGAFLVAVYSGYFGAAAGVLLLALLLTVTDESLARATAMRNLLGGLSNGVAAVAFVAFGPVRWWAVVPLAVGFLIGGRLGPLVVRNAPPGPLRALIAAAGIALAIHLGVDAYR